MDGGAVNLPPCPMGLAVPHLRPDRVGPAAPVTPAHIPNLSRPPALPPAGDLPSVSAAGDGAGPGPGSTGGGEAILRRGAIRILHGRPGQQEVLRRMPIPGIKNHQTHKIY